jgi:hypothetical protein
LIEGLCAVEEAVEGLGFRFQGLGFRVQDLVELLHGVEEATLATH